MTEWDDGFAMYCGQEWKTDDDHTHECGRSPGHSVIESFHVASGTSRTDHWCYCGSKTVPMAADTDPALDEYREQIEFLRENASELGLT